MKKVSKQKSLTFLFALKGAISRGLSLEMGIEMLSKFQGKPINKYLNQILFLVKKKNKRIFELLEQFGFITKEEKVLFEKAKDIRFVMDRVLEMRKIQGSFTKAFLKLFPMLVFASVFMPLITYAILGKFTGVMSQLFYILKAKGITPTFDDLGLPSMFYYVWDKNILLYVSVAFGIFFTIFFGIFFYLKRYKPSILYKLLPPTAYDDLPFLLSYMGALNRVGYPIKKVADILAESDLKPGWKLFFNDLKKRVKKGENIYLSFQRENFPKEIVTYVKYDEMSGDFWGNIESLKELSMMRNRDITELVTAQIKPYMTLLGWGLIIYFITGVMLFSFAMNNLSNLIT